jgi:hypothetical protein
MRFYPRDCVTMAAPTQLKSKWYRKPFFWAAPSALDFSPEAEGPGCSLIAYWLWLTCTMAVRGLCRSAPEPPPASACKPNLRKAIAAIPAAEMQMQICMNVCDDAL